MHQPDPSGDDRARQQHYLEYLEWRDQQLKAERSARRQWWLREALIVVALVVGATSFIALLMVGHRDLRHAAPALTSPSDVATASLPSPSIAIPRGSAETSDAVAAPTRDSVTPAVERKAARPQPAPRVSHASRAGTSSQRRGTPSDVSSHVAATATTAPTTPSTSISTPDAGSAATFDAGAAPSPAARPSSTEVVAVAPAPSPTEVMAVVPEPSRTEVVAVAPQPSSAAASAARSECADMGAVMREDLSSDGRTRKQRVADCVGGWLKGESGEFRDGVKRQVSDFRDGVDTVGRGLQWLGSKLRRAD